MFAAKEIVLKMQTMTREDATKQVLGTLKIKEVDRIVDRLRSAPDAPAIKPD